MADINDIAKQFVEYYYRVFSQDRSQLISLYREGSMLSWEDSVCQNPLNIIEKLKSLPFQKVEHNITTLDVQPTFTEGNPLVLVTGLLVVDDSPNPLRFCQMFHLVKDGGTFFVGNDFFRLNIG